MTMRARTPLTLIPALALALAACGGGATAAPTGTPAPSATPEVTAEATPDACATENLGTVTAGRLTIGTDNPAYPPYFEGRDGGNTEPWDPEQGDPTTGTGFESATAYAIAAQLGYAEADVDWIVVPFTNSFAPGPKDFDVFIGQVTFNEERTQGADLSEGYYFGNQTVVVMEDSEFATATTITELKEAELGAQVGTTSLATIEDVIQTTPEAAVFNSTDDAIEAMTNGQIDGIVVDLPTAFFITNVQISGGKIVGQIGEAAGAEPEHFSLVLELESPLTDCVNGAVSALADDGSLDDLVAEWLPDASVPELQP
jgi:polar amino acid transport system substrate-binding protein